MHHVNQIHTTQIVKNHRYDLCLGLLRVIREARKNAPTPMQKQGHGLGVVKEKVNGWAGPEPAILNWYGHCGVNKLGGSGGILKLGILRSLLRPRLGQNATRITPPVVSVAREASARNDHHAHAHVCSPSPICALASRSSIAIYRKLRSLNSLVATLDA